MKLPMSAPSLVPSPAWLACVLALVAQVPALRATDSPQWRGPSRSGSSSESGLLAQWPQDGPKLSWRVTHCGSGYATPSVVGDRIFLLGNEGLENESVHALSASDGSKVWSVRLGKVGKPDQKPSFPGARSTPTVVGPVLYALGSDGDLACVETDSGTVRWRKNLRTEFAGRAGQWAYSESPLVDGNTVVVTPGGTNATMLALDAKSGDVLWKFASPDGDEAGYSSAIVVEAAGGKQYVQLLQKGLAGVDAKSGKLLWKWNKSVSKYGANIPSPLLADGVVYAAAAGTGGGAVRLKAASDAAPFEELYFESKLPTAIGGTVQVGPYLYGTTAQSLLCFEAATGKLKWEDRSIGAASLYHAGGLLFLRGENGAVALVEPSPDGYREKGRFTPPEAPAKSSPMEKSWAYPVVANGKLYLRDHGTLWCYAVR
ncbi:MAG: PQQ-like beta-propeller repeat protein [Verrucomicrobiales bacterium]|nr:PQQ-like beta-propeller repeat protein [Verrucomicrobiales bacterium]